MTNLRREYLWISWLIVLAAVGCRPATYTPVTPPQRNFAFRLAESAPTPGTAPMSFPNGIGTVHVYPTVEIDNDDVLKTTTRETEYGDWAVSVHLTPRGATKMSKLTAANKGKLLAIVINKRAIAAPKIVAVINDRMEIDGGWKKEEAAEIARGIAGRE